MILCVKGQRALLKARWAVVVTLTLLLLLVVGQSIRLQGDQVTKGTWQHHGNLGSHLM